MIAAAPDSQNPVFWVGVGIAVVGIVVLLWGLRKPQTALSLASPAGQWTKASPSRYAKPDHVPSRLHANQWALLVEGYEPSCKPDDDPQNMPTGVYQSFKRMKEDAREGKLTPVRGTTIYRASEIDRDELRKYYEAKGEYPPLLFPERPRSFLGR